MNDRRPDLDRIKRCIHELPASLEGPDAQRLEFIYNQIKHIAPVQRHKRRSCHTLWWVVLALSTGMAAAAIWHQAHRLTVSHEEPVQAVPPAKPQQADTSAEPVHNRGSENPITRPDTRFIPK